MVVGFAADGRADRVIGIDASAKPEKTREQITRIAKQTAEAVDLGRDITERDVVLDERFGGPEYGLPNEGTLEAIRLCARMEGMLTDPVYEGKSMHGMIERVRNGEFPAVEGALRAPGRRAGAQCLQLPVPRGLSGGIAQDMGDVASYSVAHVASVSIVFMLRAVPALAAGIFSFERAMPLP